jgi:FkbM family methyltransferase
MSNVVLHRVALGSKRAETIIRRASFSDASSLLELSDRGAAQWGITEAGTATVQLWPLDDYVSYNELERPGLIKLDVQGFELEALSGASQCLETARYVITEVSFDEFYVGQCLFHQIVAHLAGFGFELHALGCGTSLGTPLVQADVLFKKRDAATSTRAVTANGKKALNRS